MNKRAVDWWQVIVDLERQGYTLASMAGAVGVGKTTLVGWKNNGYEPGHSGGERLVMLWCTVKKLERSALPHQ